MKVIWLSLLVVLIMGCSKKEEKPKKVATPWDEQINTMNESKQLGQFVIDTAGKRKQEIDEQLQ